MNNSKTKLYRIMFLGKINQILLSQRIGKIAQGAVGTIPPS